MLRILLLKGKAKEVFAVLERLAQERGSETVEEFLREETS